MSTNQTTVTLMNPPMPGAILLNEQDPSVSSIPSANGASGAASRTLSGSSPVGRDLPDDGKRAALGPAPVLRRGTVHHLPSGQPGSRVAERTPNRRHTGESVHFNVPGNPGDHATPKVKRAWEQRTPKREKSSLELARTATQSSLGAKTSSDRRATFIRKTTMMRMKEPSWVESAAKYFEEKGLQGLAALVRLVLGIIETALIRPLGIAGATIAAPVFLVFAVVALIATPFALLHSTRAAENCLHAAWALLQIAGLSAKQACIGILMIASALLRHIWEGLEVGAHVLFGVFGSLFLIPATLFFIASGVLALIGLKSNKAWSCAVGTFEFAKKTAAVGLVVFNAPHPVFESGRSQTKSWWKKYGLCCYGGGNHTTQHNQESLHERIMSAYKACIWNQLIGWSTGTVDYARSLLAWQD